MDNRVDETKLGNISAGAQVEPEEFDWRTKGFITPVKDQTSADPSAWHFEAMGENGENVTGGSGLDQNIEQLISSLTEMSNSSNAAIINSIIDALTKYGFKAAEALIDKLVINDETTKNMLHDCFKKYSI